MTPEHLTPQPYIVSYTDRVREQLIEFAEIARQRGDGRAYTVALAEFNRRLLIYPQFGDPLYDLQVAGGRVHIGIVPPLAMRYSVFERRRLVLLGAMPVLLPLPPRSGQD